MKMKIRRTALASVLVLAPAMGPLSCQTVQKATGTQEVFLKALPDRVVPAAEAALENLSLTVRNAEYTSVDGMITARTAQNKNVTIKVYRDSDATSRVTVKVGALGDASISSAIIAETKKQLE